MSILELEKRIASLGARERALFERFYRVTASRADMTLPAAMEGWVKHQFGATDAVAHQPVVRVTNLLTLEETLFNPLRNHRPLGEALSRDEAALVPPAGGDDQFADVFNQTPEDSIGRLRGQYAVTAANVASYDGHHSLMVFNDYNPLDFTPEKLADYLELGWRWAGQVHEKNPQACYYTLAWNCLWRAGASIVHGHAQMLMATGQAYGKVESHRRTAQEYRSRYGSSYFDGLFRAHDMVGLAWENSAVRVLSYLTPVKDNGVLIMAERYSQPFSKVLYRVLDCYRRVLGVTSFNLLLALPPLGHPPENWDDFPLMAWLVDRGPLNKRVSDIGSMELFAASIVATDPLSLAEQLRQSLNGAG